MSLVRICVLTIIEMRILHLFYLFLWNKLLKTMHQSYFLYNLYFKNTFFLAQSSDNGSSIYGIMILFSIFHIGTTHINAQGCSWISALEWFTLVLGDLFHMRYKTQGSSMQLRLIFLTLKRRHLKIRIALLSILFRTLTGLGK